MIKGYYSLIAAYLSTYVRMPDGEPIPPDVALIKKIISDMIRGGRITKSQMKHEALRISDVIIREDLFPTEEE